MNISLSKLTKSAFLSMMSMSALCSFGQNTNNFYPNKVLTFVVPYSSGTTADILARMIGPQLAQKFKIPVLIDNRVGASGIIGSDFVAKSNSNGYTLLFTATSHGTTPALKEKLPFDPIESFTPIIYLGKSTLGIAVTPKIAVNSFKEFIEYNKNHFENTYYSSPGSGGIQHLAMELVSQETGLKIQHVPYKGAAGAITDLISGQVQSSIISIQTSSNFINSGQIKMIAVLSDERHPAYPHVPTMKELGFNNLTVDTWYGVLGPANMLNDQVLKMNSEINEILSKSETQEKFKKNGLDVIGGKPEILKKLISNEISKWNRVVKNGKIEQTQ